MKKQKMYIPVVEGKKFDGGPDKVVERVSLVCANKVRGLEEYLPTPEMLAIHLQQQKIMLEKDKKYKVHPLYLFIEDEDFAELIDRIHAKNRKAPTDNIPLVCQYPAIPICILMRKRDKGKVL